MAVIHKPGMSRDLSIAIQDLGDKVGKAGWFPSAQYEGNKPVAYIAAIQEYGSGAIPPRSFQRTTVIEKQSEWKRIAASEARKVLKGTQTAHGAMVVLAAAAAGDMVKKIKSIYTPVLKVETVKARIRKAGLGKKKSLNMSIAKPLVDSGYMIDTLTSQVTGK
jgi:hypothetical protein